MRRIIMALAVCFGFLSNVGHSHEGHNHDAPTTIKAPKGGMIKSLDESRIEVLSKGSNLKIYLYDKDMKPAVSADFKMTAKAVMPRTKKTEEIKLEAKDGFYEGVYDAKGVHRYTLKLEVTHLKVGHTDDLTFNIEPRK